MDDALTRGSDRVRAVRTEAIRIAARRCLSVEVSPADAARLAEGGSVPLAMERLAERLAVRRRADGVELGPDAQRRMAIAEAAAALSHGLGNDPSGQRALRRRLVDREVAIQRSVERGAAAERAVEELHAMLERTEPRLRGFVRAAARLFSDQRARLVAGIRDRDRLDGAISRLAAVHARHLELARTYGDAPLADDGDGSRSGHPARAWTGGC